MSNFIFNFVNTTVVRYALEFNDPESLNVVKTNGLVVEKSTGLVGVIHLHSDEDVERQLNQVLKHLISSRKIRQAADYLGAAFDGATEQEFETLDLTFRIGLRTELQRLLRELPKVDLKSMERITEKSVIRYVLSSRGVDLKRLIRDRCPEDAKAFLESWDIPEDLVIAYKCLERLVRLVRKRNAKIKSERYHQDRARRKASGYKYKTSKERPRFSAYQWETIDEGLLDKLE